MEMAEEGVREGERDSYCFEQDKKRGGGTVEVEEEVCHNYVRISNFIFVWCIELVGNTKITVGHKISIFFFKKLHY